MTITASHLYIEQCVTGWLIVWVTTEEVYKWRVGEN